MKETQASKRPKKPFIYSPLFLFVLAVFVVIIARGTWDIYMKERESSRNAARVQEELRVVAERHQALVRETSDLQTDEGIERALREKFQISKENERVIVIVDEKEQKDADKETDNPFSKAWSKMTSLFKKNP